MTEGKIVQGSEPPATIKPFSSGTFSASGREGSAVAPKEGKIFIYFVFATRNIVFKCQFGMKPLRVKYFTTTTRRT